ncbi:prohead core protein [Acinetobacter phage KARL-1]|uniref:Prohead core protein n=3 Tax=Lazarusvirus TaxID=2842820 RepID=A0A385IIK3_9CAUD|nr:prohead [Acinetobacter phage KARL-1]YP_009886205.1 prohead [Acinetobacter phage vB_AbaM_Berthold]AXY82723.1 prohead core protein [Acinetobacter phage KARL-1]QGZ15519.1 prohead core protein [Acinetobacter phage vB_AbaM_Berthold]QKN88117.1 prohead core protein [Acinetobacter phage Abraxas]
MDDIIKAIASNDLVKFKRCFNEAMAAKVGNVLAEEKLKIAKSVMIEGEDKVVDDEDDDNDDDDEDEE